MLPFSCDLETTQEPNHHGDDPRAHWAQVLLTAASIDSYKHPAGHALAGQLNDTATGNFKIWQMTTLDPNMAADTA